MQIKLSSDFYASRERTLVDYSDTGKKWEFYFSKQYSQKHQRFYQLFVSIPNEEMELMNISACGSGIDILKKWIDSKIFDIVDTSMNAEKNILRVMIALDVHGNRLNTQ